VTFISYNQVERKLEEFIKQGKSNKDTYTLERMRRMLDFLGNPQDSYRTIHIAGTSGKTSTAYYCAALLIGSGLNVGITVSPHIDSIAERAQINLKNIPEIKYCEYFTQFMKIVSRFGTEPTYFEITIAFAFWVFREMKVDVAVIEVGLGGLLDGTNVITRQDKIAIITDIGLDHTEVLGNSITLIAKQKAGIIHGGNSVFMSNQATDVINVIHRRCQSEKATLHIVDSPNTAVEKTGLPQFQKRNLTLAISAINYFLHRDGRPQVKDTLIDTVTKRYIPARFEVVQTGTKKVIMDGSHNSQKIEALVTAVHNKYPADKVILLVSFGENKLSTVKASLELLRSIAGHIIVTSFDSSQDFGRKSIDPLILASICHELGYKEVAIIPDLKDAMNNFLRFPNSLGLITGSFFLVSAARPLLNDYLTATR